MAAQWEVPRFCFSAICGWNLQFQILYQPRLGFLDRWQELSRRTAVTVHFVSKQSLLLVLQLLSVRIIKQFWIVIIPLHCFLHILAISRQEEAHLTMETVMTCSFRMTSRVLYHSAQYHMQRCTLQAFEQFGTQSECHTSDQIGIWT